MSRISWRWLAGKFLGAIVTLLFVLIFNFFLFRVMGDPTSQLAKVPGATKEETAQLKREPRARPGPAGAVRRLHGRHA